MLNKNYIKSKLLEFSEKCDEDILEYLFSFWETDKKLNNNIFRLIGTYEKANQSDKNGNEYGFFTDIRNHNGDILYYPFNLGQIEIWTLHRDSFEKQNFVQIEVKLQTLSKRQKYKNPFLLGLASNIIGNPKTTFHERVIKEDFIKKLFSLRGATSFDARTISNALRELAGGQYTDATQRFIFELLQNADDMPNETNFVNTKFVVLKENLLFIHNGKPFDENDIEAITDIGNSINKRKNSETTGYKGIGFKSVFKLSDTVLIKSNNYSFAFDKDHPIYNKLLKDLYLDRTIDEIPWQLKPIWCENYRYPMEVKQSIDFLKNENVCFALSVNREKISEYSTTIFDLFNDPRFLLFLRNIKTIEVISEHNLNKIQKIRKNDTLNQYEIINNEIVLSEWIINDFDFEVPVEVQNKMLHDADIPDKLKRMSKSKLSFATEIKESIISKSNNSKLFAYLPTDVIKYNLPFIVNADFLTTANRQGIIEKNDWNTYIFEQVGFLSIKWIKQIAENQDLAFYVSNIIPTRFENSNEPIHIAFNKGFDKAIEEIDFLPTINSDFCKAEDALIDFSGFSKIIGTDLFIQIVNPTKQLLNLNTENKAIQNLKGISIFTTGNLKELFLSSNFKNVLTADILLNTLKYLFDNELNIPEAPIFISDNVNDNSKYFTKSIYFQANKNDRLLLNFIAIPFVHPLIENYSNTNPDFRQWLLKQGLNDFEGASFIRQNFFVNQQNINNKLSDKNSNLIFWRFIFKYSNTISDNEISRLNNYFVFDINNKLISNITYCYLSDYYKETGKPSIQQIANDLGLQDFNFISEDYCQNLNDKPDWRKLFHKIGLKPSENIKVLTDKVLPFINNGNMNEKNYLPITKFLFDIFNENRAKINQAEIRNFKVLTTNNILKNINECILSDFYTDDLRLSTFLSEIQLANLVSDVYLKEIKFSKQSWKEFFLRINPNIELNSGDLVKKKIEYIANNPTFVNKNNVLQIWQLSFEHRDSLLRTHKELLKKIPILLKNENLELPAKCYFPNEYSPNTDIETLLKGFYSNFISPLLFANLNINEFKLFLKQIGIDEEIKRTNIGNSNFDVTHKELLTNFDFAERFWNYFVLHSTLFTLTTNNVFKSYIINNSTIPCLDKSLKKPSLVHSFKLKESIGDNSVTCRIEFSDTIEKQLGIQQIITIPKCFEILNNISNQNNFKDKRIKTIYDALLQRFTTENINQYLSIINDFKVNGKLLSNRNTFTNISLLFNQDIQSAYLPLDESEFVIQRFGDKEFWKKFETVLKSLGIQIITANDFALNSEIEIEEAPELTKTLKNSLNDFAIKIDNILHDNILTQLNARFDRLKIHYCHEIKLECQKLNYSPTVPNYYDVNSNTIYYSGKWNSISNAKLIEYLFKALEIKEIQLSREEFIAILLKNIPAIEEGISEIYENENSGYKNDLYVEQTTGRCGEEFLYTILRKKFENCVVWLNAHGEASKEYDFIIYTDSTKSEIKYFVDAKATSTNENDSDSIPFFIRQSEWNLLMQGEQKYIVARIFNPKLANPTVRFLHLHHKNLDEIEL
ncbi:MAG: DUF3883 domain-containing protein [Bacteroidales bacterium]|nr:DUF3883 domain-containing protein [Bacteroidales bacterium]